MAQVEVAQAEVAQEDPVPPSGAGGTGTDRRRCRCYPRRRCDAHAAPLRTVGRRQLLEPEHAMGDAVNGLVGGFGNSAQVAGYRAGMLIGGAALLTFVGTLGEASDRAPPSAPGNQAVGPADRRSPRRETPFPAWAKEAIGHPTDARQPRPPATQSSGFRAGRSAC